MTEVGRVTITHGIIAISYDDMKIPNVAALGAGYVEGIARLGVPALTVTDAS